MLENLKQFEIKKESLITVYGGCPSTGGGDGGGQGGNLIDACDESIEVC